MSKQVPKCDFFVAYGDTDYLCEVYSTDNGHVEDFGLFLLLDDGSKGDPVDTETMPVWEQVQQKFEEWIDHRFGEDREQIMEGDYHYHRPREEFQTGDADE